MFLKIYLRLCILFVRMVCNKNIAGGVVPNELNIGSGVTNNANIRNNSSIESIIRAFWAAEEERFNREISAIHYGRIGGFFQHRSGVISSELKCYVDLLTEQKKEETSRFSQFLDKLGSFLKKIQENKNESLQENIFYDVVSFDSISIPVVFPNNLKPDNSEADNSETYFRYYDYETIKGLLTSDAFKESRKLRDPYTRKEVDPKELKPAFEFLFVTELSECISKNSELITKEDADDLLESARSINDTIQEALKKLKNEPREETHKQSDIGFSRFTVDRSPIRLRSQTFFNLVFDSNPSYGEVRFSHSTSVSFRRLYERSDNVQREFFSSRTLGFRSSDVRNNLAQDAMSIGAGSIAQTRIDR
jgi:hypothetical protein